MPKNERLTSLEKNLSTFTPEKLILSPEEIDTYVTERIIKQVTEKPNSVITLPTGNSALGFYAKLIAAYDKGRLDMSKATIFNLDEYYPIRSSHPNSYAYYMKENLFDHVNVGTWHIPDGEAQDPQKEAERYGKLLKHSSIDLAILGIGPGRTCHIGFNEKGSPLDSRTRYVPIVEETKQANIKQFSHPADMPDGAITQGVADILQAKNIVLIAKGSSKAWGINRTLNGPISEDAPASFLRLHPKVTFALDHEAAQTPLK